MANNKEIATFIVVVDRIEGQYAVCLMPDFTTKDVKIVDNSAIKENDKLEVKYNAEMELEFIRIVKDNERRIKRRIPGKLIRFN